ncbi:hypothetical protein Bca52824_029569 [Brassica carinata]|uniref:DUF1771 domain-containing protein n=1 Tax=Brassica carinata TaxID=52824 RepID=A0A8X7VEL1_BRACI|nr:hypothetical protein Bca52824_029569 [Brassica carinata]
MSMIASSSHSDPDSRSLQVLLDAFGSHSLRHDYKETPQSDQLKTNGATSKPARVYVPKKVQTQEDKVWRPKKSSVSVGTISSVIGKEYARRTEPASNARQEAAKVSRAPTDVEEFIAKMLGEGFQASPEVIQQILGVCGYDVMKSTEKLLDLSDTKKHADVGISNEVTSKVDPQRHESLPCNQVVLQDFSQSGEARTLTGSHDGGKNNNGLEKEVLQALFSGAERYEEVPKVTRRIGERRARVPGRPVFEPLEDPFQERVVTVIQSTNTSKEDEDDENEYKAHRIAVHENLQEMKEYYRAAVEAFFKGETERAHRLVEKGHFFGQKAREADDKSIAKMLEVKEDDGSAYKEDEVVIVNVNEHEPREALRLLKLQLRNFSGIPSIKYLRVKLGDNKEDSKCKRRLTAIAKLLAGESIAWSEEDSGLVMMIRVDEISHETLSFAKK